jgi:hypothetical protein
MESGWDYAAWRRHDTLKGTPTKQTMRPDGVGTCHFLFSSRNQDQGLVPLIKQQMLLSEHCLFCDPVSILIHFYKRKWCA